MLEALEHSDVELAQIVIDDDDRLDGRYLEVHQGILSLLARQAPVAGDLRLVAALLHLIKHVERMGDQCVNIAKLIPLSGHEPPVRAEMLEYILRMGRAARSEVVQAKAAFSARDVALAEDLVRQDREINRLNREVFQLAIDIGDDPDTREWAMHMTMVARAIERIGDNAVDIGEVRPPSSSPGCSASSRTRRLRSLASRRASARLRARRVCATALARASTQARVSRGAG